MPMQSGNDTDKMKKRPVDIAGKTVRENEDQKEPNQANYGFSHGAELDTEREETEKQEYTSDGLPRTQQYSFDKVGRSHERNDGPDSRRGDQKGHSDCGC